MGEWWAERWKWERDTHRLTVATDGATLAGFSYVGPSEEDGVAELYAIHADPAYVGAGVGRALMLDALPALARLGDRAVLWVLTANTRARRFYERGGWAARTARPATRRSAGNRSPSCGTAVRWRVGGSA
ncbi:hypothetical protein GCM10020358_63200 [Amorphoplanes nipponensis]